MARRLAIAGTDQKCQKRFQQAASRQAKRMYVAMDPGSYFTPRRIELRQSHADDELG
jgi:hypothetical protein